MSKRALAAVLALFLTLSMSACGKEDKNLINEVTDMEIITDLTTMTLPPVTTTALADYTAPTNKTSEAEVATDDTTESESTTTGATTESETATTTTATPSITTTQETTTTASVVVTIPVVPSNTTESGGTTVPVGVTILDMGGNDTTTAATNAEAPALDVSEGNGISVVGIQTIFDTSREGKNVWWAQLTATEQENYKRIFNAVYNFEGIVKFDEPLTDAEYEKVYALVYYQNPELFWMGNHILLSDDGKTGTISYMFSKEQATTYQKSINKQFKSLIANMTSDMSDLQMVIACNNFIVLNTDFAKGVGNSQNVYGTLVEGYGQCEGYAKTFMWMMNKLNIPCVLCVGVKDTGASHAWCQVKLHDGSWYNVDTVGNDPILPVSDKMSLSYRYLCVPNSVVFDKVWFNVNYSPRTPDLLYFKPCECNSYTLNGDINYGVYAETYEDAYEKIKQSVIKAVENRRVVAHCLVGKDDAYTETYRRLISEGEIWNIVDAVNAMYESPVIEKCTASEMNSLNYIEIVIYYVN